MPSTEIQAVYARLKTEAEQMAGDLLDIRRRAAILHNIYLESGENHVFPQIAAHGALWAYRYFEVGGKLGQTIAYRYFYNRDERAYRLGLLNSFAEGFRRVNRLVCIDTYTNFHFTREHGEQAGAEEVVHPELLDALNRVHAAKRAERALTEDEKQGVFQASFKWEQEITVAPGVAEAVAGFDCPILRGLCLKPLVRFAYFPALKYIFFRDFSSKEERIAKGFKAYDLARRGGWSRVVNTMKSYRLLPAEFFAAPREYYEKIRREISKDQTAEDAKNEKGPRSIEPPRAS